MNVIRDFTTALSPSTKRRNVTTCSDALHTLNGSTGHTSRKTLTYRDISKILFELSELAFINIE